LSHDELIIKNWELFIMNELLMIQFAVVRKYDKILLSIYFYIKTILCIQSSINLVKTYKPYYY